MAMIMLDKLWLQEADNQAEHIAVRVASIDVTSARRAEVRSRAGGRQVVVNSPTRPRAVNVQLVRVSRSSAEWIEARLGDRLFLRDPRGRALFVAILSFELVEAKGFDVVDVRFAAREVSGTVAV